MLLVYCTCRTLWILFIIWCLGIDIDSIPEDNALLKALLANEHGADRLTPRWSRKMECLHWDMCDLTFRFECHFWGEGGWRLIF